MPDALGACRPFDGNCSPAIEEPSREVAGSLDGVGQCAGREADRISKTDRETALMTDSATANYSARGAAASRLPNMRRASVVAPREPARRNAELSEYRAKPWSNLVRWIFSAATVATLWIGWLKRDDGGLTPESGVGYWLGIAGSALMLLLLVYPLRKRKRSLRLIGSVPFWFRAHMILGVLGSVLVLWHANFHLGSINSNVALFAMLVVAGSGIVGRYLYGKIHHGLYGRKAAVQEILADSQALKEVIRARLPVADRALAQLNGFARLAATAPQGVVAGLVFWPKLSWQGTLVRKRAIADARQAIAIEGLRLGQSRKLQRRRLAAVAELVSLYVTAVKKAAAFGFYERLFSLWHFLHVPLFLLLVAAAIVHVFAAHFF